MIEFSADQSIEEVLNGGYYEIPRFQRPYSWTSDNIGDFWADVFQTDLPDYFIGAFIMYTTEGGKSSRKTTEYAIVDGQQRFTTITILLAAIRDALLGADEEELARGVQGYIERRDRRNKPRFILETESGYPYFHGKIQSYPEEDTADKATLDRDEKLIKNAYEYFNGQLSGVRESIESDSTIAAENKRDRWVQELEKMRDAILGLTVIVVRVENVDDAYIIFETLNTRGKELSLADLVRSFLLRDLKETSESADIPRTRFNSVLARLYEPGIGLDSGEFIHHSWLSRRDYVPKKKLYRRMKARVRSRDEKEQLLRSYEIDVGVYVRVRRPGEARFAKEEVAVERSLRALRVFNMTQPIPFVLAAVRAHEDGPLSLKQLKRALTGVESFHFQYTAIAGKSSSGGVSLRYAKHGRQFVGADSQDCADNITVLLRKLRESLPTLDEFMAGFSEIEFSRTHTRDKDLVRYILENLYRAFSDGSVEVDFDAMTIEHIAPENPPAGTSDVSADLISSIGNLILVTESLNNKLANKDFEAKREILRKQDELWVDPQVLEADAWGEAEIRKRTKAMGKTSYESVWTF